MSGTSFMSVSFCGIYTEACGNLFDVGSLAVGAVGAVPCMYAACLVIGCPFNFLNGSHCEFRNLVLGISEQLASVFKM